jgi:hypothetical protein
MLPSVRARPFAYSLFLTLLIAVPPASAQSAGAKGSSSAGSTHPPICPDGVRRYAAFDSVPAPFDTLTMPRGAAPIRITSPDQEAAAEREVAERAGSVGATGLVLHDEVLDGAPGVRQVRRRAIPVFVPSDSARAQAACRRGAGDTVSSAAPRGS